MKTEEEEEDNTINEMIVRDALTDDVTDIVDNVVSINKKLEVEVTQ